MWNDDSLNRIHKVTLPYHSCSSPLVHIDRYARHTWPDATILRFLFNRNTFFPTNAMTELVSRQTNSTPTRMVRVGLQLQVLILGVPKKEPPTIIFTISRRDANSIYGVLLFLVEGKCLASERVNICKWAVNRLVCEKKADMNSSVTQIEIHSTTAWMGMKCKAHRTHHPRARSHAPNIWLKPIS